MFYFDTYGKYFVKKVLFIPNGFVPLEDIVKDDKVILWYNFFETQIYFTDIDGNNIFQTDLSDNSFIVENIGNYYVNQEKFMELVKTAEATYKERKTDAEILQLAENGGFNLYNFKMGDSIDKVREELGEPIAEAGNDGAFSYVYNNMEVFYNPLSKNKEIVAIDFRNGKIYGLVIDKSSIDNVIDIFGEPVEKFEFKRLTEEERERIIEEGGIADGAYEYWTEDGYKWEEDDVVILCYDFPNNSLQIYIKHGTISFIMYYTKH
jgi:predicted hydrocarbon binding protein